MFVINITEKIKTMYSNIKDKVEMSYWKWQYRDYHQENVQEIDDTYEFIWGIKSWDDLSGATEANFWTMNDFDITFNKKEKTYSMSVETIYMFDNGKEGEKKYVKAILDKFTEWMNSKGYDTTRELKLWEVFTSGNNIRTEFETIEEMYATFKFLVNGYIN